MDFEECLVAPSKPYIRVSLGYILRAQEGLAMVFIVFTVRFLWFIRAR